ncbi:hypothetical protein ACTA71_006204 [Dictyostelium dimigraforme]
MPKTVSNGLTTKHSSVPSPTVTIDEKEIMATIPQYDNYTNRTLKEWNNDKKFPYQVDVINGICHLTQMKYQGGDANEYYMKWLPKSLILQDFVDVSKWKR